MIQIHEVIKTFDGKEVLRNLNLNVERGTIYGLLGANVHLYVLLVALSYLPL